MRVVLKNTTGHHIAPSIHFRYTFTPHELLEAQRDRNVTAIIHHGEPFLHHQYEVVHSHLEALTVFSRRDQGLNSITRENVAAVLSGTLENWEAIGGMKSSPIKVGVRADGLFLKCLLAVNEQYGLCLRHRYHAANSYADLAAFGRQESGAFLIGLRGSNAKQSFLTELEVPDPFTNKISLLLRKNSPLASELGQKFAASLASNGREDGLESEATSLEMKLLRRLDKMKIEHTQKRLWAS